MPDFVALGPACRFEIITGEAYDRIIGGRALRTDAAQGARVQIATSSSGLHQIDLVPRALTPAYMSLEHGKWVGGPLVASDVDPGGVFQMQNLSGLDLVISDTLIMMSNPAAAPGLADVGVSVNPIPAGGSNNIFDGIDFRNGGVARHFDSRWAADHPGTGRPSVAWQNNEWVSITNDGTGSIIGIIGYALFKVFAFTTVKPNL